MPEQTITGSASELIGNTPTSMRPFEGLATGIWSLVLCISTVGPALVVGAGFDEASNPRNPLAAAVTPATFGLIRIMPLGDSITESSSGFGSYRYYLWQDLAREGFTVDFVGSMTGTGGEAADSPEFDSDHEGHPGWRADEVADHLDGWAGSARPDVVLIHLGTNDLAQGQPPTDVIRDLTRIIDRLRVVNPHVHILVAQIIPMGAEGPAHVLELNAAIATLADRVGTADSPVEAVDQFTGFDHAGMTWDGIHPNRKGNKTMATVWMQALLPHLRMIHSTVR
ncbi:MAG: SGNH/GDSL hydrolase family protein [Nitrospiraceae bacterium]